MAGYTRSYSKTNGNTILATDFNNEYQAIDDAFNASTGHAHDGSTDEGAYVPLISDTNNYTSVELDAINAEIDFNINVSSVKTRQLVLADGALLPDTTNDVDLGSGTYKFKDFYLDGNITVGGTVDGRDLATDGTKLDSVEANADVTDSTSVAAAGAVMDGDFSANGIMERTGAGTYTTVTAPTGTIVGTSDSQSLTNKSFGDGFSTGGEPNLGAESGSVTISTGNSGVTSINSQADDLIIEGTGTSGITIATPAANEGRVHFADPAGTSRGYIIYNHTSDYLKLGATGTDIVQMDSTNGIVVAAQGIKLDNLGSSDVNTLDDYEEGSWNPVLSFSTPGDLSVSYTYQVGKYTKIGNKVSFTSLLSCTPTFSTASGYLNISLPFTPNSTTNQRYIASTGRLEDGGSPLNSNPMFGIIYPSLAEVRIVKNTGANHVQLSPGDLTSGSPTLIEITGVFYV